VKGSRDLLYNFYHSTSRERLKLETTSLACRLATGCTKRSYAKLGQKRCQTGHVTYFLTLGTKSIFWERLS